MDTPKKPQHTSKDEVTPAAAAPVAPLQARSPFRPLSRRKRQEQVIEPPSAVDRPVASGCFDASPTTISAALARATASFEEPVLVWRATSPIEDDVTVEVDVEVDDENEPAAGEE